MAKAVNKLEITANNTTNRVFHNAFSNIYSTSFMFNLYIRASEINNKSNFLYR